MLTMLGSPRRCCDGLTRRETLKAGALSLLGGYFNLPSLYALEAARPADQRPGPAKSVIVLYLLGGAATQDMWDLKPNAPAGVRSEFKPIATSAPGVQICEHLPRMAQWMHKAALIRSLNHKAGCHNCLPSYSGCEMLQPDQHPHENHPPSMGSVCEYLRRDHGELPDYIYMPCWLGWGQAFKRGGPYAGFLGHRYDPLITECAPYCDPGIKPRGAGYPETVRGEPLLPNANLGADMTIDRLNTRRSLLSQVDEQVRKAEAQPAFGSFNRTQQRAFSVLSSPSLKSAFDLKNEPEKLIERYGRTLLGQSTLIARRLVERGVRFVNVTWDLFWDRIKIDFDAWDTHQRNFHILKGNKLPGLDQTFSALMEDLQVRGLLDETLIVVMSEMGRTPRVNGAAGRDHWTYCYSAMLAGAGIRGGTVYGASDAQAAFVRDKPVSTSDICSTIYHCLGIDPETTVPDRSGRPIAIAQGGRVLDDIVA
jgi:hypothetical protein